MPEVRKMAERWWIEVCPECNGHVDGRSQLHNETCPNRGKLFATKAIEVVPVESLAALADLHHRTIRGSKLHYGIESFMDCPAKTCRRAREALGEYPLLEQGGQR